MLNKKLLIPFLAISLFGCAAGTANVHRSNIDIYTNLIVELGPISEDSSDEARRRGIYMDKLTENLKGLEGVNPEEARVKREKAERILGSKI